MVCFTAFAAPCPRIGESRVAQQRLVGQRLQEGDEVGALRRRQREAAHRCALVRVVATDAPIGPVRDRASAGGVVIDGLFERGHAAVVHVRRGHGDVAQRRRLELADVLRRRASSRRGRCSPAGYDSGPAGCRGRCCGTRPPCDRRSLPIAPEKWTPP